MLRFLRKYNKIILVVGGCLLMVAFMAQGTVDQLISRQNAAPLGTIGDRDVTPDDVTAAAQDIRLLQSVSMAFSVHYPDANFNMGDFPKPLDSMQWILMLADAEKMGLSASRSEAIQLLKTTEITPEQFKIVLSATGASEDRVLTAIKNWSVVQQYMSMVLGQRFVSTEHRLASTVILQNDPRLAQLPRDFASLVFARRFVTTAGAPRVSEPMLKRFVYDQSAVAEITAIEIKSDQYLNVIAAPTPEEMKTLFEQYKGDLPGASKPYGFGYRYPDRVKIEFIKVPFNRVLELVKNDKSNEAELEAEAYEYYVRNKDDYIIIPNLRPANIPSSGILPFPGLNPKPNDGKDDTKKDATKDGDTKDGATKDATTKDSATKDGKQPDGKKADDKSDSKDAKKSGNATDLTLPRDTVEVFLQDVKDAPAKADATKDTKTDDKKDATTDAKKDDSKPTPIPTPAPAPTKDGKDTKAAPKKDDTKTDGKTDVKKDDAKTDEKTDGKADETRVPVIEFQPFRNVRKGIIATLQRQKAEKLVGKIAKAAQTILLSDVRGLSQAVGYYQTNKEGWKATSLSDVAKQIQDQFGLLPDVVRYDGNWLDEDGVKAIKDFGVASVIGQRASAWQYVFSAKTFIEAGSEQAQLAILRLQAGVASQPVVDSDESQYLFRIIAAESSQAPDYDKRLDEVERDARKLAAYKAMLADADKWHKRVKTDKLEDIATKEGVIVTKPAPFRKRVPDVSNNVGGLSVPSIGEFGKSAELTDAIFAVADAAFTKGDLKTLPDAERTGASPVDGRLSMALFRVESYKPITKRDYELQVLLNLANSLIQQGLTSKDTVDPLSEDALAKRVNFIRDEDTDEDEDAEKDKKEGEAKGAE